MSPISLQARKLEEAATAFSETIRWAEFACAEHFRIIGEGGLAVVGFLGGRTEAIYELESALANAQAIDDEYTDAVFSQALGEIYTLTNEFERAAKYLDAALTFYSRTDMRPYLARALNTLANMYELQGRDEEAKRARDDSDRLRKESKPEA